MIRSFHHAVHRPYRIPIPDWAAFLLAFPPIVGILAIFLVSNWYVYVFSIGAILISLGIQQLGSASKQHGWFSYETKSEPIPYGLSPTDDRSTVDETESDTSTVTNSNEIAWEYKNEEHAVIQKENTIT